MAKSIHSHIFLKSIPVLLFSSLSFCRVIRVDEKNNINQTVPYNPTEEILDLLRNYSIQQEDRVVNLHNFSFTILESNACQGPYSDVFLLVIVHTSPGNYKRRMFIRGSYGNHRFYRPLQTVVMFAIGITENEQMQQALLLESDKYHDIIQENFIDTYRNLTYKAIMWLKWTATYCASVKYVLKLDDDTVVNPILVVDKLRFIHDRKSAAATRSIICAINDDSPVMRGLNDKWFVSEEDYPNDEYGPYCLGSAYILSGDLIGQMYENAFLTKFFWIDDFYTTGLLPRGLNATYYNIISRYLFHNGEKEQYKAMVEGNYWFVHVGATRIRHRLWFTLFKEKGFSSLLRG